MQISMNKSLDIYHAANYSTKTVLLECIYEWCMYVLLGIMTVQLEYIDICCNLLYTYHTWHYALYPVLNSSCIIWSPCKPYSFNKMAQCRSATDRVYVNHSLKFILLFLILQYTRSQSQVLTVTKKC